MAQWLTDSIEPSPRTLKFYEQFVRCHVKPEFGDVKLSRLSPQKIESFLLDLQRERGLSSTTAHHIGTKLRGALGVAVEKGLIAMNPCEMVQLPKRANPTPQIWSVEEATRFLKEAWRSSRHPMFYALALTTGLRAGELLRLSWGDLDLGKGVLYIRDGKTANAKRAVLFPEELVGELRERRGIGLLFHTKRGTALNLNNLRHQDFKPTIVRAGVPDATIHSLRHFHASFLLSRGVDLASLSGRMGHASKGFTLQSYGWSMAGGQERAAQAANDLLTSSGVFQGAP